jgi:two-component system, NarL family, invasion response regulator UvrY
MLNAPPKILIADDHPIFRSGVRKILSDEIKATRIAEAQDAKEAMRLVRTDDWDIVLLDISMLDCSGLQVLKDIRTMRPRLPILMLSTSPSDQLALRAIANGANGYLSKDCDSNQLKTAVKKVLEGGKYVCDAVASDLLFNLQLGSGEPLHRRLSDREYQIMLMIAVGKSLSRIAEELLLSVKTVSTYRARLLQKMRMLNNADLIRYALQENLV